MTKKEYTQMFTKFWEEQAPNMYDYNSLDIYFEDGTIMKMFIFPWYWSEMNINIPKVVFTYQSDTLTMETPFAPAANKYGKKVETFITDCLDYLKDNGIDVALKSVRKIYENVLKD